MGRRDARTSICTADADTIVVRGEDLCRDLIGKLSFTDYFHLLLTGQRPRPEARAMLDAALVAIAEHGLVPSVQASRMTLAAAPEAMQGAIAAGLLGCGSVILGAAQDAGVLLNEIDLQRKRETALEQAALSAVETWHGAGRHIPGYGHSLHRARDPRVSRLFALARDVGIDLRFVEIAEAVEGVIPRVLKRDLRLNVSAAIPAVLLGVDFPLRALRGIPLLARTAGLIAHLHEEAGSPIGFALADSAARDVRYDGPRPPEAKGTS